MRQCTFCENEAVDPTPGGDWVCEECGDNILEAHYAARDEERPE